MLTPRENHSTGSSEDYRTHDAASRRPASPTHYRQSYSGPLRNLTLRFPIPSISCSPLVSVSNTFLSHSPEFSPLTTLFNLYHYPKSELTTCTVASRSYTQESNGSSRWRTKKRKKKEEKKKEEEEKKKKKKKKKGARAGGGRRRRSLV